MQNVECRMQNVGSPSDLIYIGYAELKAFYNKIGFCGAFINQNAPAFSFIMHF